MAATAPGNLTGRGEAGSVGRVNGGGANGNGAQVGARNAPDFLRELPTSRKKEPEAAADIPQKKQGHPAKNTRGRTDFAGRPAKNPEAVANSFAGQDAPLIDDEDLEQEDQFAAVDPREWRTETRTYTKKDGTMMLYINYRSRVTYVNENGKRTTRYKKGGKKVLKHGKRKSKK